MAAPSLLPEDRTDINSAQQFTFVNSPVHLRIQNGLTDNTIQRVIVYLWVWNGSEIKDLGEPNFTLLKDRVSASDTYINFQVADLIKPFIKPEFAYNELAEPAVSGQGVFWQYIAVITSEGGEETVTSNTYFATLGYRWNYEQNKTIGNNQLQNYGSTGFVVTVNKWYNDLIHGYIEQNFVLDLAAEDATTEKMIVMSNVSIPEGWNRCTRDPSLIVFLNKLGLWEMFTPHGKFIATAKVKRETTNRVFRDPSNVDNSYQHSKQITSLDSAQSYTINTGSLTEDMISIVEEIIYSPMIYLIRFKGDRQLKTTVGTTIDSTYVTIDDTIVTIDSVAVTEEFLGMYKTHQQIPVVMNDDDFTRKTRVNDKNTIDYTLKFDETNNKILDIR